MIEWVLGGILLVGTLVIWAAPAVLKKLDELIDKLFDFGDF